MTETKRDLTADLAICDAATESDYWVGLHSSEGVSVNSGICLIAKVRDRPTARFIAEARTGWPDAIKRALEAEREVARLRRVLTFIAEYQRDQYESPLYAYDNCKIIAKEALAHDGV
jgi:hypothetical protein